MRPNRRRIKAPLLRTLILAHHCEACPHPHARGAEAGALSGRACPPAPQAPPLRNIAPKKTAVHKTKQSDPAAVAALGTTATGLCCGQLVRGVNLTATCSIRVRPLVQQCAQPFPHQHRPTIDLERAAAPLSDVGCCYWCLEALASGFGGHSYDRVPRPFLSPGPLRGGQAPVSAVSARRRQARGRRRSRSAGGELTPYSRRRSRAAGGERGSSWQPHRRKDFAPEVPCPDSLSPVCVHKARVEYPHSALRQAAEPELISDARPPNKPRRRTPEPVPHPIDAALPSQAAVIGGGRGVAGDYRDILRALSSAGATGS